MLGDKQTFINQRDERIAFLERELKQRTSELEVATKLNEEYKLKVNLYVISSSVRIALIM
jgi:hypothetical protein